MAQTSNTAKWITWIVLGGTLIVVGASSLMCIGLVAGTAFVVGNGAQYDVARLARDECTGAILMTPDDDGGLQQTFADVLITINERDQGRKLTARERRDQAQAADWLVPTEGAFCMRDDEDFSFAFNPRLGGRFVSLILNQIATGSGTAQDIQGYPFVVEAVVFGAVDGTIVAASSTERAESVVADLLADTAPESAIRTRIAASMEGNDVVLSGLRDGAESITVAFDFIDGAQADWVARIDPGDEAELDLQAAGDAFCEELLGNIAPATSSCTARVEGDQVHVEGTASDLDTFLLGALDDDDDLPPIVTGQPQGASSSGRED